MGLALVGPDIEIVDVDPADLGLAFEAQHPHQGRIGGHDFSLRSRSIDSHGKMGQKLFIAFFAGPEFVAIGLYAVRAGGRRFSDAGPGFWSFNAFLHPLILPRKLDKVYHERAPASIGRPVRIPDRFLL